MLYELRDDPALVKEALDFFLDELVLACERDYDNDNLSLLGIRNTLSDGLIEVGAVGRPDLNPLRIANLDAELSADFMHCLEKLVSMIIVFVEVGDAPATLLELHGLLVAKLTILILLESLEVLHVLRVEDLRVIQLFALDCHEVCLHLDVPALQGLSSTKRLF